MASQYQCCTCLLHLPTHALLRSLSGEEEDQTGRWMLANRLWPPFHDPGHMVRPSLPAGDVVTVDPALNTKADSFYRVPAVLSWCHPPVMRTLLSVPRCRTGFHNSLSPGSPSDFNADPQGPSCDRLYCCVSFSKEWAIKKIIALCFRVNRVGKGEPWKTGNYRKNCFCFFSGPVLTLKDKPLLCPCIRLPDSPIPSGWEGNCLCVREER